MSMACGIDDDDDIDDMILMTYLQSMAWLFVAWRVSSYVDNNICGRCRIVVL